MQSDADRLRALKLAQIEELVLAEEREGFGRLPYADTDYTLGEHSRQRMLAALAANPQWEPPRRWYTDEFGRKYGLPISEGE